MKNNTNKGKTIGDAHADGISQQEIADRLGVSRARVSFLERQALRKLRAAALAEGLSLEDLLLDPRGGA